MLPPNAFAAAVGYLLVSTSHLCRILHCSLIQIVHAIAPSSARQALSSGLALRPLSFSTYRPSPVQSSPSRLASHVFSNHPSSLRYVAKRDRQNTNQTKDPSLHKDTKHQKNILITDLKAESDYLNPGYPTVSPFDVKFDINPVVHRRFFQTCGELSQECHATSFDFDHCATREPCLSISACSEIRSFGSEANSPSPVAVQEEQIEIAISIHAKAVVHSRKLPTADRSRSSSSALQSCEVEPHASPTTEGSMTIPSSTWSASSTIRAADNSKSRSTSVLQTLSFPESPQSDPSTPATGSSVSTHSVEVHQPIILRYPSACQSQKPSK